LNIWCYLTPSKGYKGTVKLVGDPTIRHFPWSWSEIKDKKKKCQKLHVVDKGVGRRIFRGGAKKKKTADPADDDRRYIEKDFLSNPV